MESQSGQARKAEIRLSLNHARGVLGTSCASPEGRSHYFENDLPLPGPKAFAYSQSRLWGLLRHIVFMRAWCARTCAPANVTSP